MVIMALDHVRDLLHVNSLTQSPTNLDTTTPVLFFTRWITYLCAPVFVFLAGASAYLSFSTTENILQSRNALLKRGLYLVALEFVVINFILFFDMGFHTILFEVIAAIGVGFIILSLLMKVSAKTIGAIGLAILMFHNVFPLIPVEQDSVLKVILSPLFTANVLPLSANRVVVIAYPPVPWLGIMLTGFASGQFFAWPEEKRKHLFFSVGGSALLLFLAMRFINVYGDLVAWSPQRNTLYTFLSFINVTKYPPSLLFCLLMLGIMFFIMAAAEGARGWLIHVALVYGRVPLFYFLAHFFLIHVVLMAILFLQGFHWSQLNFASGTFGRPAGVDSGLSLGAVYVVWIAVVLVLYKPCLWFGRYKSTHHHWWLRYL